MSVVMVKDCDNNSYTSLKTRNKQVCEFCDEEFDDRYSCIVHNSSHIIIPLLKQSLYNCDVCHFYFTTSDDLNEHMNNNHYEIKQEINVPQVKIEKCLELEECEIKHEASNVVMDLLHSGDTEEQCCNVQTKDKIKFEDDFEIESLRKLTTDCKVELYSEWSCYNQNEIYEKNNYEENKVLFEKQEDFELNNVVLDGGQTFDNTSVPYCDLIMSGVYICRYCTLPFPNRFRLVLHETEHLRFAPRRNAFLVCVYCGRYIAGNYDNMDRHLATQHGGRLRRKHDLKKCRECHLPYTNNTRHLAYYHQGTWREIHRLEENNKRGGVCDVTGRGDDVTGKGGCDVTGRGDDVTGKGGCDVTGRGDDVTGRGGCDVTGRGGCDVTGRGDDVRIYCSDSNDKGRILTGTREDGDVKHKTRKMKKMNKRLTNEERLKNIRQRLKLINKLSKF